MPRISVFYGIALYIYYRDHATTHFHAFYDEFETTASIETGDSLEGRPPLRARSLVSEWAATHQDELRNVWELARDSQPCRRSTG